MVLKTPKFSSTNSKSIQYNIRKLFWKTEFGIVTCSKWRWATEGDVERQCERKKKEGESAGEDFSTTRVDSATQAPTAAAACCQRGGQPHGLLSLLSLRQQAAREIRPQLPHCLPDWVLRLNKSNNNKNIKVKNILPQLQYIIIIRLYLLYFILWFSIREKKQHS